MKQEEELGNKITRDYDPETLKEAVRRFYEAVGVPSDRDFPQIDLYMDQVTTFLEGQLMRYTRRPDEDKILTKTMINNYTKAGLLIPPVRKRYGSDHLMLLVIIYILKNFLSIGDIQAILQPVEEACFTETERTGRAPKRDKTGDAGNADEEKLDFTWLYNYVIAHIRDQKQETMESVLSQIDAASEAAAAEAGTGTPEQQANEALIRNFDLICRLSTDIYMRKLIIEKLIDGTIEADAAPEDNMRT